MHDLDKYYAFASTLSSRGENSSSSLIWSWSWSWSWSVLDGPPKDTFVILKYFVDFGKKICPSRARAEQSLWGIWGFHLTKSCTKNPTHSFLITPTDTLIVVLVSCSAHCMCDSVCVSVCVCVYECVIEKSNSLLDCCSSWRNWFNLAYEWFNIELWLLISAFAFTFSTFRNRFTYAGRLTTGLIQYAKLSYCHYSPSFRSSFLSFSLSSLRLRFVFLFWQFSVRQANCKVSKSKWNQLPQLGDLGPLASALRHFAKKNKNLWPVFGTIANKLVLSVWTKCKYYTAH